MTAPPQADLIDPSTRNLIDPKLYVKDPKDQNNYILYVHPELFVINPYDKESFIPNNMPPVYQPDPYQNGIYICVNNPPQYVQDVNNLEKFIRYSHPMTYISDPQNPGLFIINKNSPSIPNKHQPMVNLVEPNPNLACNPTTTTTNDANGKVVINLIQPQIQDQTCAQCTIAFFLNLFFTFYGYIYMCCISGQMKKPGLVFLFATLPFIGWIIMIIIIIVSAASVSRLRYPYSYTSYYNSYRDIQSNIIGNRNLRFIDPFK